MHRFFPVHIVCLLLALPFCPVRGQSSVSVIRLQDLVIGSLQAGERAMILPGAPGCAKFSVCCTVDTTAVLQFVLPDRCTAQASGAQLPLEFSRTSAAWSYIDAVSGATVFDPWQFVEIPLMQGRPVYIWLGVATAPSRLQHAGRYNASITLSLVTLR